MHDETEMVQEFMDEAAQKTNQNMETNLFSFRMCLVAEEFKELAEAGGDLLGNFEDTSLEEKTIRQEQVLKELCDCIYVLKGMAVTFGWDVDEAFDRVHNSNMTKFPFSKSDDGKVVKGPEYVPCNLEGCI